MGVSMDYCIKIDEFEGPLDLLLHLIKESNIDIYEIEISLITKQYLNYINKMEELNIDVAASYLVMAAELMEIKSKSLLPKREEEETMEENDEEVSRENLINKLVEYQKYKEMTGTFKQLESSRKDIFIKAPEKRSNYLGTIVNDNDTSVDDLVEAFKKFLERKDREKPITTKITSKEYSVKERKYQIKNILRERQKVTFTELFEENNLAYIIVTFLSILEMTKEKEVVIKQDKNFSDISVELGGVK